MARTADLTARCVELMRDLPEDQRRDVLATLEDFARETHARRNGGGVRPLIERTWGRFAHLPTSSDDYAREKTEEKVREDRR